MSKQAVKKVKVAAYPIPCQVTTATGPKPIQIIKLTMNGFLAEAGAFARVGKSYAVQFSLPVLRKDIMNQAKIMKTYARPGSAGPTQILVEFQFGALADVDRKAIHDFLVAISPSTGKK